MAQNHFRSDSEKILTISKNGQSKMLFSPEMVKICSNRFHP
jgi:hypothetical protein